MLVTKRVIEWPNGYQPKKEKERLKTPKRRKTFHHLVVEIDLSGMRATFYNHGSHSRNGKFHSVIVTKKPE